MKKSWAVLLIAIAVLASYAPALRNGFVWDDTALILRDPLIRSWRLIPEGFQHFLFTDATASDFYRPLQRLTYTLEYWAVGFQPAIFHLISILCHLGAAVALYFFATELLRLFGISNRAQKWIALLTTLVWAIHPVQSAAVVYVSGRADPLAAFFGFFGLYFGIRTIGVRKGKTWAFVLAATSAFLLSALSKEMGLVFPFLLMAILAVRKDWIALRNASGVAIFVFVVYLSLRLPAEHNPPPPRATVPVLVRPLIVARAVAEYAGLIALPLDLHMDRDVETHPSGFGGASLTHASRRELQTLLGIILIGAGVCWMVRARAHPAIFTCLLLAAISYLPVSGIFLLNATVAEHWIYLPSAFLFLAIGLTASVLFQEWHARGPKSLPLALTALAILWMIFLAARTFVRTFDWRDQQTFLERTVAQGGQSVRMLINLGSFELGRGNFDAANKHLHEALRREPDQPLALLNLATVAIKQSNFKLAHDVLGRAVQIPFAAARAHELLAVLENKETGQANLLRMRLAARTGPPDWSIEKRYIKVLDETGSPERAIAELQYVLATQSYRAESWQMLAQLLTKVGRSAEAAQAHAMAKKYDVRLSGLSAM